MQHRIPKRKVLIKVADLAENFGTENKHEGNYFKSCGKLNAKSFFYKMGKEVQYKSQKAGEDAFPLTEKNASYKHADCQYSQSKIYR